MKPIKIARVQMGNEAIFCIVEWNELYEINGDLYGDFEKGKRLGRFQFGNLLSPVVPGTIYGLGINHKDYKEFLPKVGRSNDVGDPIVFTKPTHSAVGMSEKLIVPAKYKEQGLKGSGELGVIIKKDCHNVTREEAAEYILGYTNAYDALPVASYYNDEEEKHKAKGYPTFCPMGPYIVIGIDVSQSIQRTYYNNTLILEGKLDRYVWDPCETISQISKNVTLKRNDVLILGACAPQKEIQETDPYLFMKSNLLSGDVVSVETEGLGRLMIAVADEQI